MKSFAAKTRCEKCALRTHSVPFSNFSFSFQRCVARSALCSFFCTVLCMHHAVRAFHILSVFIRCLSDRPFRRKRLLHKPEKGKETRHYAPGSAVPPTPRVSRWINVLQGISAGSIWLNSGKFKENADKFPSKFNFPSFSTLVGLSGCFRKILSAIERCRLRDGALVALVVAVPL